PQIRAIAAAVNAQDTTVVERLPRWTPTGDAASWAELQRQGGCWLSPQPESGAATLRRLLESWADYQYLAAADGGGGADSFAALLHRCSALGSGRENDAEVRPHLDRVFAALGRARLLTLVREGPWGCEDINRFIDRHVRPRLDPGRRGGLFAGAPVLVT